MKDNYELAIIIEPYFESDNLKEKTEEIESLVLASGARLFTTITQKIREISPATFVGSGKLEEIRTIAEANDVNLIVFDGEFSPSQQNNISDILDIKVISRTTLILDIFAMRALSPEGKILVELAQLKYLYPRLSGKGIKLSRLGGGIGTRGPGETQLETDRRHIKTRIKHLERNLDEIEKRRKMQQQRRDKNNVKTVALVGYTNTGKSTLLNLLCDSDVLAKDQLFATLDPTARKADINGYQAVFIDTVGFVKALPPDLMEAFKSTLECAVYADLLLCVFDASANWEMQVNTTKNTLLELGATAPILLVANKCDNEVDFESLPKEAIKISAKNNIGIENLKNQIFSQLFGDILSGDFIIDYSGNLNLNKIKELCKEVNFEYLDNGIKIHYIIAKNDYDKLLKMLMKQ